MVAQQSRDYELVMILSPEATEEEISATVERVDGMITSNEGSIEDHEIWGLRRLAFPVEKQREGNYVLTRFGTDPSAVAELNRSLKTADDIMRFLVTKVESRPAVRSSSREAKAKGAG